VCKLELPKTNEYFGNSSRTKDGFRHQCKKCRNKEYLDDQERLIKKSKLYYENNKEKCLESSKLYRQKNLDWYQSNNRIYYQNNKAKMIATSKRNLYKRIENDVGFKMLQRCRKRLYEAIKEKVKSARTKELIGCTTEELKIHIENQFTDGMNWNNYGKWHIDHIIPCASFDFSKQENQFICFNYKNLQPLWAIDNIRKSDNIVT
jgi:hypothetical protein